MPKLKKYDGLTKIISGGQTGADQGGLTFAFIVGIPTGGTAPKGFRTEKGFENDLLFAKFHLKESKYREYPPRTRENVQNADGTVIFSEVPSRGSELTHHICVSEKKPYIVNPDRWEFVQWLTRNNIKVLNVAGNRESVSPGIEKRVIAFLTQTIERNKFYDTR